MEEKREQIRELVEDLLIAVTPLVPIQGCQGEVNVEDLSKQLHKLWEIELVKEKLAILKVSLAKRKKQPDTRGFALPIPAQVSTSAVDEEQVDPPPTPPS